MTHGSLFSGIGGFDLAAEWMGWENVFHCEWNPFGQRVLKHYWPNATSYEDITKTDFTIWRGRIDVLTGGFPCQPFSTAGKRKGKDDNRYLWPEMLRAIREIRPTWICGENVAGLVSMVQPEVETVNVEVLSDLFGEDDQEITTESQQYVIETICRDLESLGYSVQPIVIPACAAGAPHRRDRIWFIAHNASYACNVRRNDRSDNREERHISNDERIAEESKSKRLRWQRRFSAIGSVTTHPDRQRRTKERKYLVEAGRKRFERLSVSGFVTNPNSSRAHSVRENDEANSRETTSKPRSENSSTVPTGNGCEGTASYSNSEQRREGGMHAQRPKETERHISSRNARGDERGAWDEFPTQPPVCHGNDGLSGELDGITFPKWRTESIKAGGNAIVPQVAHQIFKAIQEFENLNNE